MVVKFRNYTEVTGITEDYKKIREFLISIGHTEFTYARWDWMITHRNLNKNAVEKIGIWEEGSRIRGIATFDCQPGEAFCLTHPDFKYLKKEMIQYAMKNLANGEDFGIVISDSDYSYQDTAADLGFIPTEQKEHDAIFYVDKTSTEYILPEGFKVTSMKDNYDLYQYGKVLWKGFNHEIDGEGTFQYTKEVEQALENEMFRLNVRLDLKIAALTPKGDFAAYCGMWYDPDTEYAVIEPVATDPEYRKMGLGKAVVLEGIKRVRELGAKKVLVGSSQQFYYSIGLRPYTASTVWRRK